MRSKVWKAITEYLQKYVDSKNDTVLELGAGYCDFINNIVAKKKIAIDTNKDVMKYVDKDVLFYENSSCNLNAVDDYSVNVVFASNLFEHLDHTEIDDSLREAKRVLVSGGKLIVIQPNFRYSYREYFDDYTHKTAYSHISLSSKLHSAGFIKALVIPRFLPLTMDSKLPKSYLLTKIYLSFPFKPFAKQMMLIFNKAK